MANGVVGTVISDGRIEFAFLVYNEFLETDQFKSVPERCVIVATFKVQGGADSPRKEERVYSTEKKVSRAAMKGTTDGTDTLRD